MSSAPLSTLQEEIISFMFKRDAAGKLEVMPCLQFWFGKDASTDIEIEERFGQHVEAALAGGYADWKSTPRGCLALMILLDQFPRNLYRNNVRSFSGDKLARELAYCNHSWLDTLKPEECLFVPCLVMTHQENLADQKFGVAFYEKLEPLLPTELRIFRTIFEEHLRIIYLCGTFPHRDHYYAGRKTSEVGRKLLDNPKLRFDLPLVCKNGVVSFGHDPTKLWKATQGSYDVVDRIEALVKRSGTQQEAVKEAWLTPTQSAELKGMFRQFDKDGSGFLDIGELSEVLASTGHPYIVAEVQGVVDGITGSRGSTGLTFEQFATILQMELPPADQAARARARFNLFDLDKSGEVSFSEFSECISGLDKLITTAEIELMFERADKDKSGQISMEEFLHVMEERAEAQAEAERLPLVNKN